MILRQSASHLGFSAYPIGCDRNSQSIRRVTRDLANKTYITKDKRQGLKRRSLDNEYDILAGAYRIESACEDRFYGFSGYDRQIRVRAPCSGR